MIVENEDVEFCKWVADERNRCHLEANNERISVRDSDTDIHFEGVVAELAWRRDMQIPEQQPWVYEDRDPGFDFTWAGLTVDVKASKPHAERMMIPAYKVLSAQLYVMSTVREVARDVFLVKPVGGISRKRFKQIHEVGREFPPFRIPTRWVLLETLTPIEQMQDWGKHEQA